MKRILIIAITLVLMTLTLSFAAETAQNSFNADPRLDQKVTIKAHGELLHKVIADLVKQTKIDLRCGANPEDWQVRDRKLIIIVKDMPLKDLQTKLAELLHFTWRQFEKDGKYSYRLYQSAAQKKEEEELRGRVLAAFAAKAKAVFAEYDKLDSMTEADIEKLRTTSPWLYIMAKEKAGIAVRQLLKIPGVREAIMNREQLEIPQSELQPHDLAAAKSLVKGMIELMTRMAPPGEEIHIDSNLADMGSGGLVISVEQNEGDPNGLLGMIGIGRESHLFPIADPASKAIGKMGELFISGRAMDESTIEEFETADKEDKKSSKRKITLPDDPIFEKKIDTKDWKDRQTFGTLDFVAEKTELFVISDYFTSVDDYNIESEFTTLKPLVTQALENYDKEVKKDGDVLVFQDYEWFTKRSWEVSEKKLESWRRKVKAKKFTLADLVDVAKLTDAQIEKTILKDDEMGNLDIAYDGKKTFLRFFGSLSYDQQLAAMSEAGLPISSLSASQRKAMEKSIDTYHDYDPKNSDTQILTCAVGGNGYLYDFELASIDEKPADQDNEEVSDSQDESYPISWRIALPGLVEDEPEEYTETTE